MGSVFSNKPFCIFGFHQTDRIQNRFTLVMVDKGLAWFGLKKLNKQQRMTCIEGNLKVIEQITHVIKQLTAQQYAQPLAIFENGTLGKHFRHIHDFYACLLSTEGIVDYTQRDRDELIESIPSKALEAFGVIQVVLKKLTTKPIKVIADFVKEEQDRSLVASSIDRELMFLHDHAVHHLAIIRIGIKAEFPEVVISNEVGVAPSTLQFKDADIKAEASS